ncbi:MAG: CBS domain-containing protein [Thermoplasmata archaeon]
MPKEEKGEGRLRVSDFVITDEFDTVSAGTTVRETVRKLLAMKRGVVLVKDGENILGVVTERKILRGILEAQGDPLSLDVSKVMDTHILYVRDTDALETALEEIKKNRPAAVIVRDAQDRFRGYFSPIDYIEAEEKLKAMRK